MSIPNWTTEQTREAVATLRDVLKQLIHSIGPGALPQGNRLALLATLEFPCPPTPTPANQADTQANSSSEPRMMQANRACHPNSGHATLHQWTPDCEIPKRCIPVFADSPGGCDAGSGGTDGQSSQKPESCNTETAIPSSSTPNGASAGDTIQRGSTLTPPADPAASLVGKIAILTCERDEAKLMLTHSRQRCADYIGEVGRLTAERDQLRSDLAAANAKNAEPVADLPSAEIVANDLLKHVPESVMHNTATVRQCVAGAVALDRQRRMPKVDWVEKAIEAYYEWCQVLNEDHFPTWLRAREAKGGGK